MINIVPLQSVDRTIYEHLRLKLVELGHLPDVLTFGSDKAAYEAAKLVIKNNPAKELIEVYGTGASESRDKKHSGTIIINRKSIVPSAIGGGTVFFTENKDEEEQVVSFKKQKYPEGAARISYDIRTVAATVKIDRIITDVIFKALKWRAELKLIDSSVAHGLGDDTTLLTFLGDADVSSTDWIEKVYKYAFTDVWLDATQEVLNDEVPILKEITIKVKGSAPDTSSAETVVK